VGEALAGGARGVQS